MTERPDIEKTLTDAGLAGLSADLGVLRRIFRSTRSRPCAQIGLWAGLDDLSAAAPITLAQIISTLLPSRPVIYPVDCPDLSFDEAWLLRLIAARRSGDLDSLQFGLASRLPRAALRPALRVIDGLQGAISARAA